MTTDARRRPGIERMLAVVAVLGGALAVVAGSPTRATRGSVDVTELARIVEHEEDHVTAVELAKWIRDDKPRLRILDIRADSEFGEFHIPGATRVPLAEIARMPLDSAATYVLYSEGGTHAAQGWFLLRARGVKTVFFLRGGLYEWLEQVMSSPRGVDDAAGPPRFDSRADALVRRQDAGRRLGERDAVPSVLDGSSRRHVEPTRARPSGRSGDGRAEAHRSHPPGLCERVTCWATESARDRTRWFAALRDARVRPARPFGRRLSRLHRQRAVRGSQVRGAPRAARGLGPRQPALAERGVAAQHGDHRGRPPADARFFAADPDEYEVVFTANASGAVRLVAEAFRSARDRASCSPPTTTTR